METFIKATIGLLLIANLFLTFIYMIEKLSDIESYGFEHKGYIVISPYEYMDRGEDDE